MMIVSALFGLVVVFGFVMLSFKGVMYREKSSVFECGFDPKSSARIPFSLRFFLLAVIFLVFDVEVVLLMPYVYLSGVSAWVSWSGFIFLLILLVGLLHEWREGSLEWSN